MNQEDLDIQANDDGYLALKVRSVNDDDVVYQSTLWVPQAGARALAEALRAARSSMNDHVVTVSDGTYVVFSAAGQGPSSAVHVEMQRAASAPHGGYDTLSLSNLGAERAAALLDSAVEA